MKYFLERLKDVLGIFIITISGIYLLVSLLLIKNIALIFTIFYYQQISKFLFINLIIVILFYITLSVVFSSEYVREAENADKFTKMQQILGIILGIVDILIIIWIFGL